MRKKAFYILPLLLLGLASCGIYSLGGVAFHPEVRTVSVEYFPNQAEIMAVGLSETFTDKLRDKYQRETNLRLDPNEGDIQFSGAIVSYFTSPVSVQTSANAQLNRLTIVVRVTYTNRVEPHLNFETNFTRFDDFDGNQNLADVEQRLIQSITDQLVQDIFNRTALNW